jgi:hypothetical protein
VLRRHDPADGNEYTSSNYYYRDGNGAAGGSVDGAASGGGGGSGGGSGIRGMKGLLKNISKGTAQLSKRAVKIAKTGGGTRDRSGRGDCRRCPPPTSPPTPPHPAPHPGCAASAEPAPQPEPLLCSRALAQRPGQPPSPPPPTTNPLPPQPPQAWPTWRPRWRGWSGQRAAALAGAWTAAGAATGPRGSGTRTVRSCPLRLLLPLGAVPATSRLPGGGDCLSAREPPGSKAGRRLNAAWRLRRRGHRRGRGFPGGAGSGSRHPHQRAAFPQAAGGARQAATRRQGQGGPPGCHLLVPRYPLEQALASSCVEQQLEATCSRSALFSATGA